MRPRTFFLSLSALILPLTALDLWVQLNLDEWAEQSAPLPLLTRTLIAVDNVFVRYALVVGVIAALLGPLLAAALPAVLASPEGRDSRPDERAQSILSSLGRSLLAAVALTGLAVSLEILGPVRAFGLSAFLGWSAWVALLLVLAQMYRLQEDRRRAGRSRWRSRWLVGLTTLLNCVLFPIACYLLPAAYYFYGRHELGRYGASRSQT